MKIAQKRVNELPYSTKMRSLHRAQELSQRKRGRPVGRNTVPEKGLSYVVTNKTTHRKEAETMESEPATITASHTLYVRLTS